MKVTNLRAAFVAVVASFLFVGCGGGGGGGSDGGSTPTVAVGIPASPVTPVTPAPNPPPISKNAPCPDGTDQAVGKICPVVGPIEPVTLAAAAISPHSFKQGATIQFNGTLLDTSVTDKNVVLWHGAVGTGTAVAGTVSLAAGKKDITYVPTQWLANGQSYTLAISINDSIGRLVQLAIPFTTNAMVCSDNVIWSNPATFSATYQDCVAGIGVQTLVNPNFNTLQDGTCTITIGTPLSSACKAYMANATMVLADTSVVVNGHASIFMVYGTDAKNNNIVLLDANDPNNLVPVGMIALPNPFVWMWIIGYPTGASISLSTNTAGVFKSEQVTWSASTSTLVEKCTMNC
jgi:hypothetical protein